MGKGKRAYAKTMVTTAAGGRKDERGKMEWEWLWTFVGCLHFVADVIKYGALKKYDRDNWKKVPPNKYINAAARHVAARGQGELVDRESGLPVLAHAITDLLFVMWHDLNAKKK